MSMTPASNPTSRRRLSWRHRGLSAAVVTLSLLVSVISTLAQAQAPVPRGNVTVNFVNADIEAVTRAVAAMINRQISVDPRVRGTITLYSEQPQSVREAYQSYLSALRGLGFSVVESGGLLKVVPEADAKLQTGTVSIGEVSVRGDQVITQVFNLRYENANNLVAVLRPLITANNTINASPTTNTLVITDYAENLQRLGKIIAALDTPAATEIEVVPLQHVVASDIVTLVQRLADGGGQATLPGVPGGGGGVTVLADARSNALILRAPNPARLAALRATIAKLDRPVAGSGPGGGMWVVHLKNADAVRLATVVRAAFAAVGTGSGAAGAGAGGGSPQVNPLLATQPNLAAGTGAGGISAAATAPVTGSAQPSTGGFIQADPATNSLIITAPEPLYRQVRAMIDQLDTRRAQVYIESMIVEVSGSDAADFGFQWQGILSGNPNTSVQAVQNLPGVAPGIVSLNAGIATGTLGIGSGLNVGLVRNINGVNTLAAIAKVLQSQSNTNIISTPNLITMDNEEAKIVVGSNVPFITGQFTQTGGSTSNPFQTIERKDVGITLRIKPQIGEGGTVRMVIFQESSSLSTSVAPGTSNAGPSTNKRSIESTVVVDDGQILVLGGLIEDKYTDNRAKIPLLGDIPYLGALFRNDTRTKTRTNLMVFLRPIIMRDAATSNKVSLDRYDLIRAEQKESQPKATLVLPIGSAPVLPPLRKLEDSTAPLSVPPSERPGSPAPAASAPAAN